MIGIVMGVPTLRELFEEKYYTDLEGGILESFGRLFKNALKLYVYPCRDSATGSLITAENLRSRQTFGTFTPTCSRISTSRGFLILTRRACPFFA